MNAGARLDEVLHSVKVPAGLLEKPYLHPAYDEPEFVVRNLRRLWGGWYDQNPASLKPAPEAALPAELADVAGGPRVLADRAEQLLGRGEPRLATHLGETAALAAAGRPAGGPDQGRDLRPPCRARDLDDGARHLQLGGRRIRRRRRRHGCRHRTDAQ